MAQTIEGFVGTLARHVGRPGRGPRLRIPAGERLFTLTEFEVTLQKGEEVTAVTDLDVIAVRLPSNRERPVHPSDVQVRSDIIATVDPALHVAEDRLDVLIVEVKQGHVEFNPGMFRPATLHAGLRRVGGDLGASAAMAAVSPTTTSCTSSTATSAVTPTC